MPDGCTTQSLTLLTTTHQKSPRSRTETRKKHLLVRIMAARPINLQAINPQVVAQLPLANPAVSRLARPPAALCPITARAM